VLNQLCLISPLRAQELRDAAHEAIEGVRRLGMCRSEGLAIPGWSGIAMPIEGLESRMFAISLGLRTELLDSELKIQQAGLSLAATASRIVTSFKSAQRAAPHAPAKPGPTELRRPSGP
jgi:DNA-binding IclR family transcriptional regulator